MTLPSYEERAAARLAQLRGKPALTVLAIESSCDETAAAVVRAGRTVLGSAVHTQIPLHQKYGGVVPELASRNHVEMVGPVVEAALADAGAALSDMDALAVTCGPGLVGALLVGVSYAKGLALATGLPLVGVNHIAGHIAANYLTEPALTPPFCCLVASGGHSHLVEVDGYERFTLLGRTRDDAAGEAFDKVARMLGLPYPGGPALEKLARQGDPRAIRFHSAFNEGPGNDFSFSGIKTAVIQYLHNAEQRREAVNRADVAASFQYAVVSVLAKKALRCALEQAAARPGALAPTLALAGGVSANTLLRETLSARCAESGVRFCCPALRFCTDNAAMIGSAACFALAEGRRDPLSLNAQPALRIVG